MRQQRGLIILNILMLFVYLIRLGRGVFTALKISASRLIKHLSTKLTLVVFYINPVPTLGTLLKGLLSLVERRYLQKLTVFIICYTDWELHN